MKTKLMILLVVALFVVMAIPAFAGNSTVESQDDELEALYGQMRDIQRQIAEKRGMDLQDYDEDFFKRMYDFCNRMMGGYGMMGDYQPQSTNYNGHMMGW